MEASSWLQIILAARRSSFDVSDKPLPTDLGRELSLERSHRLPYVCLAVVAHLDLVSCAGRLLSLLR